MEINYNSDFNITRFDIESLFLENYIKTESKSNLLESNETDIGGIICFTDFIFSFFEDKEQCTENKNTCLSDVMNYNKKSPIINIERDISMSDNENKNIEHERKWDMDNGKEFSKENIKIVDMKNQIIINHQKERLKRIVSHQTNHINILELKKKGLIKKRKKRCTKEYCFLNITIGMTIFLLISIYLLISKYVGI